MFLLFGEETINKITRTGEIACARCGGRRAAQRYAEASYFTLFRIPLLPLGRRSDYWECCECGAAYASERATEPAADAVLRHVLVYVMLGYRAAAYRETLQQIYARITGREIGVEEIAAEAGEIEARPPEIIGYLRKHAFHLNVAGKEQVVEAAFLMTHASCEIQQQDRLRVNLMGGALGLTLEQTDAVLDRVRANRYYGVRRNLAAGVT